MKKTKYLPHDQVLAHYKAIKTRDTHSWVDVSHHGSPLYVCEFCDVYKDNVYGDGPDPTQKVTASPICTRRDVVLKQRAIYKEQNERSEYRRMLAEKERFEYLKHKYG